MGLADNVRLVSGHLVGYEHGSSQAGMVLRAYFLIHRWADRQREILWAPAWAFGLSKPTPSDTSLRGSHLFILPNGEQPFKRMSIWGPFSFK